jgi:F0F1-type ATP synthase epsilon subunit
MSDTNVLKVKIRDAENIIFEGEADLISSINEVGKFDVLPLHANFISMIQNELHVFHKHQKVKELKIQNAVMKVSENMVHIFLGLENFELTEEVKNLGGTSTPKQDQPSPAGKPS